MLKAVIVIAGGCLFGLSAAPLSIGVVKSTGEFRVDGSTLRGNSTLFDGNLIETTAARSIVQLDGVQITLSPDSRFKVYRDHTVIEKGVGVVKDGERYVVEAGTMRIAPTTKDAVVQIEMTGANRIAVATRMGVAEVHNAAGMLIAKVSPGLALSFEPQGGAAAAVKLTGVLVSRDGKFFLTDSTANVTMELQGTDFAKYVGQTVEVTGSTVPGVAAATGASQVVQVATIKPVGNKKKAAGATGAGAVGAGLSHGAVAGIVGGVVVGGTLVGLAAAGTFSGSPSASVN